MTFDSWRDAVAALEQSCGSVTTDQLDLANSLNVDLDKQLPRQVAAAVLRQRLLGPLNLPKQSAPSANQIEFLDDLFKTSELGLSLQLREMKQELGSIDVMSRRRAIKALNTLKPQKGDVVQTVDHPGEPKSLFPLVQMVRYIQGKVAPGKPHRLMLLARATDRSQSAEANSSRTLASIV